MAEHQNPLGNFLKSINAWALPSSMKSESLDDGVFKKHPGAVRVWNLWVRMKPNSTSWPYSVHQACHSFLFSVSVPHYLQNAASNISLQLMFDVSHSRLCSLLCVMPSLFLCIIFFL